MRILIGGSPSTGSSVFRQILNRHPQVFCGPETNLFCYRELYQNWQSARHRMFLPRTLGLQKADVRLIRGLHIEDPEIGWTRNALHRLIKAHKSFPGFCDAFFAKPMEKYEKVHWAEKTPANVLQFKRFMQRFEEAYIVHVVRNPYDTVASLVARGMSAYQAASIYLLYTAHGLALRGIPGYLEIQYESMVRDTAGTLEAALLQPLDLQFSNDMLNAGNQEMAGITRMEGWRSDELATVSDRSVGRFTDETTERQEQIVSALASLRLKDTYVKRHVLQHHTIEQLCNDLDYAYITDMHKEAGKVTEFLQKEKKQVMRGLMMPLLWTAATYPVEWLKS